MSIFISNVTVSQKNPIIPYTSQYQVTHGDLIKFGIDMTKKVPPVSLSDSTKKITVDPSPTLDILPEITVESSHFVVIDRRVNIRGEASRCRISVDRVSGYMITSNSVFSDVYRFDPQTFPNECIIPFDSVGYWTKHNQYMDAYSVVIGEQSGVVDSVAE
ncbi:MAG: hypothetical protein ACO3K7_00250 [Candidatus Marinamargulisbacteria bacterium]